MKAVVSEVRLREPLPPDLDLGEIAEKARAIPGFGSIQVIAIGDDRLVLVITADSEETLDRVRDEAGNAWMREHVVPRAAGPPNRAIGDVIASI